MATSRYWASRNNDTTAAINDTSATVEIPSLPKEPPALRAYFLRGSYLCFPKMALSEGALRIPDGR